MIRVAFRDIGGAAKVVRGKRIYTLIEQGNGAWRVVKITTVEKSSMSIRSQEKMGIPTVRVEYPEES